MHKSRNLIRKSASNLELALVWRPRARQDGRLPRYAVGREAAKVADDEFAPVEQRREHLNFGKVADAYKETALAVRKDFTT